LLFEIRLSGKSLKSGNKDEKKQRITRGNSSMRFTKEIWAVQNVFAVVQRHNSHGEHQASTAKCIV